MSLRRHDPVNLAATAATPSAWLGFARRTLSAALLLPAAAFAADPPPALAAALAVPAASAPAGDGLERVRERLAERLTLGKAVQTGAPNNLRLSPSGKPAAAKPLPAGAPAPRTVSAGSRTVGHRVAQAAPGHAHWSYDDGGAGPGAWSSLKSEYALCASGQRQSPIDIRGGLSVDLEPVRFDYQASRFSVLDNGHTVQVDLAPGNRIEVGGKRFELQQFHFHRPSEERIDGRQFEMSLHLVHRDDQGRLAVVALLFDRGPAHPVLQQVWNNLPLERGEANAARHPLEPAALLPHDRRYYTYMGSLTTPPCSEGVQWIVMRQPVTLSPEQIEVFAKIYPMNSRPLQAAAGRRILQSD